MIGKNISDEQQRTSLAERLWLAYLNQYLYEHGIISETQRNRMCAKIDSRKPSTHYFNKSLNNDYIKE